MASAKTSPNEASTDVKNKATIKPPTGSQLTAPCDLENATAETLEVWVGSTDHQDQPEHWMLMLRAPNAEKCTWFHSRTDYALSFRDYTAYIDENEFFEHRQIAVKEKIGTINFEDEAVVREAAKSVSPVHCQRFIVNLIEQLELKRLIPKGNAARWKVKVQPLVDEGPVKKYSEKEFDRLSEAHQSWSGAYKDMLKAQGWVNEKGEILWNSLKG
ncbi:hypothetical protein BJX64DRAFT_291331 [Aspergillus heterothallicus]